MKMKQFMEEMNQMEVNYPFRRETINYSSKENYEEEKHLDDILEDAAKKYYMTFGKYI